MFGIPSSFKIIEKINSFFQKDKKNNKNYKVIIAPPFTLLSDFSRKLKNKKVDLSAQNCFHKDFFGAHTGSISSFMIKSIGIKYVIIGHSENRDAGETDYEIKQKISMAIRNKLKVIFCIGENKNQKRQNQTSKILKKQILKTIKKNYNLENIIIAYEPVWSIGTGKVPSSSDLKKVVLYLKKFIKNKFRLKKTPKILYGGSVDENSVMQFKSINELDGFLIGGASKSPKKFIDIIKNFYK